MDEVERRMVVDKEERMKVGITYDLRQAYLDLGYGEEETAEFDRTETVDAIESTIRRLGFETERIGNVHSLVQALAAGKRWTMVFNIAEGLRGMGREAQVPALLDAYGIPYTFSDPLTLSLTLHKGLTKRVVRDAGIPTPDFLLVESEADLDTVVLPYPLFAKPVAEGTGKGINAASKIGNKEQLREVCIALLEKYTQPVLVETFLSGREFTVGIVGTGAEAEVLGLMEVTLLEKAEREVYSYINKEKCEELVRYDVPRDEQAAAAARTALEAFRVLGCRDAGRVDLRCDGNGVPNFVEINPLAGMHPAHSDLPILANLNGHTYTGLMEKILQSALKRAQQPVSGSRSQAVHAL